MLHPIQDDPSLVRLELMGCLARAARLALMECEQAESCELHVTATPDGMSIDATMFINGQPFTGWGV